MSQGGTQSQSLQLRRTVARDKMSDSNFLFPTFTEIKYLKYRWSFSQDQTDWSKTY
jgi:hypothetical protein